MTESAIEKTKSELDYLEREFRRSLLLRLRAVVEGEESLLFCVSELNHFREVRPPVESDRLFDAARRIESLRRQLALSSEEEPSPAATFITYCKEYNDTTDQHSRGPKKLAASLLSALQRPIKEGTIRMNEETLISLAIDRAHRARFHNLPKGSRKRTRALNRLNHDPPLDSRRTQWFSSFSKALKSLHVAPTTEVYLLSCASEIDGRNMTFRDAVAATLKAGWGTIIGVSPSLAVYYGEEGERGAVIRKEAQHEGQLG